MRLWHIDLIPVLPRQQLLGQWRELNSIYKKQDKHVLINFIYYDENDIHDLFNYSFIVIEEMRKRGYKCNCENCKKFFSQYINWDTFNIILRIYPSKMTERYLRQCYFNLQEKYDCGGITEEEWQLIYDKFGYLESDNQHGR